MTRPRNQNEQFLKTFLAWDYDGPGEDISNTYQYSPSWSPSSPFMVGFLDLEIAGVAQLTAVEYGLQGSVDWHESEDDDTATWFALVGHEESQGDGNAPPNWATGDPISLFKFSQFAKTDGDQTVCSILSAASSLTAAMGWAPIIAPRVRLAAGIFGTMVAADPATWTIRITEGEL